MPDVVGRLLGETDAAPPPPVPRQTGGPDVVGKLLGEGPKAPPPAPADEATGLATRAYDFLTGEKRTEFPEAPELGTAGTEVPPFSEKGMTMFGAYASSVDDEQIADIAMKTLDFAERSYDKHGNAMIKWRGKTYYVNKPGVSEADMFHLAAQIAAYAPATKLTGAVKGLLKRAGVMGTTSAMTSVASDLASGALGSEQGVSVERAAVAGLTGGAFEVLSPLAAKAWRFVFGKPKYFDAAAGKMTPEGEKAARAAGLNPAEMDEVYQRMVAEEMAEATGASGQRAAASRVAGREFGTPLTRGQASGDIAHLSREEATRHGAHGTTGQAIVREFDEAQQQAMRGSRGHVQSRLGGGETRIAKPAQAGDVVGPGIRSRAAQLGDEIDEAYALARSVDARLTADSIKGVDRTIVAEMRDFGLDKSLHPSATKAMGNLARIRRSVRAGNLSALTLKNIERERRKINNLVNSANNKADRAAVLKIKGRLDKWLDDAVDNGLFSGDPKALDLLKQARGKRKDYGDLFEPRDKFRRPDQAGRTIQKILAEDRTPEQVMNYIFGRGKLGETDAAVQVVRRIKEIAGEGSEEWMAMREAGWLRLAKEIGDDTFAPTKFKTNLNRVMENNESLMKELYTPDEIGMFVRFRDEVMRTVTPKEATNPSKTAYTMSRLVREWMGRMGTMLTFSGSPLGGATMFTLKRAPTFLGARQARRAVQPQVPPRLRAPLFTATGTAGAVSATGE